MPIRTLQADGSDKSPASTLLAGIIETEQAFAGDCEQSA